VREGADDGCLLLLSGALAFPRVQCVSLPEEPAFSTYISAKVGAAFTHVASLVIDAFRGGKIQENGRYRRSDGIKNEEKVENVEDIDDLGGV